MRQVLTFLAAMMLSAGAISVAARADLIPGGWLQAPRIPDPPPAEAAPPEPAAVRPIAPRPRPKVTHPAVQHRAQPHPPSDGKVQF
jgi:hypothetical protein